MKCISILQPWATLIIIGVKRLETRSWNTKFRGEILIHASKKFTNEQHDTCIFDPFYSKLLDTDFFDETKPACGLPTGAIIGKVNLCHVVKSKYCFKDNEFEWTDYSKTGHPVIKFPITDQELAFGDYSPNRYGWLLSDPVQFANPIPAKGKLSIWDYDLPDHFHFPNKYGGHATFPTPPDQKTLDAVNKMTELAYKKMK